MISDLNIFGFAVYIYVIILPLFTSPFMFMKKSLLLFSFTALLLLTWCGSSSVPDETLTFADTFNITIPWGFKFLNPGTVENKQITNKVLLSYIKDNEDSFDDNIVVTLSEIWPDLDYEQFWTVNSKKLQTSLAWYIPGNQKRVKFECKGEDIEGLFVTFDVKNTFSDIQELTYISQYQFVYQDKWYIASYASINQKDRNNSDDRLTKLSCS